MSYQELPNTASVLRLADSSFIPADPKNQDYAEYLEWRAKGNIPAAYVEPPETTEQLEAKKLEALEIIDKASTRAIRELVLDQAGILNLTGPERAAAADRLKKENDKATAIRSR